MENLDKNPCNEEADSSELCVAHVISSQTSTSETYQLCSYMHFVTF